MHGWGARGALVHVMHGCIWRTGTFRCEYSFAFRENVLRAFADQLLHTKHSLGFEFLYRRQDAPSRRLRSGANGFLPQVLRKD